MIYIHLCPLSWLVQTDPVVLFITPLYFSKEQLCVYVATMKVIVTTFEHSILAIHCSGDAQNALQDSCIVEEDLNICSSMWSGHVLYFLPGSCCIAEEAVRAIVRIVGYMLWIKLRHVAFSFLSHSTGVNKALSQGEIAGIAIGVSLFFVLIVVVIIIIIIVIIRLWLKKKQGK